MAELKKVIGNYPAFLGNLLASVTEDGFDLADFVQMDHICYRTVSTENYEHKKSELVEFGRILGETMVNGRPISAFRLDEPIIHESWRIDCIELPAPKAGRNYPEGLEHVEFVLFDEISTFLKKYKGKPFDMRAADRGINPEIGLQIGNYPVKFHLLSLPTVVYIEDKLGIDNVKDGQ